MTFTQLKERWHIIVVLILLVIGFFALSHFYNYTIAQDAAEDPIIFNDTKKPVYLVGYVPLLISDNGTPTGFDIDVITWLSKEMNFTIEFVQLPWDDIFHALQQGEIDLAMSGISITPERAKNFAFSNSYLSINQTIAVSEHKPKKLHDFYAGIGKIGVESGTTGEKLVYEVLVQPGIIDAKQVQGFPEIRLGAGSLSRGEIDYIITDWPVMQSLIQKYPIRIIGSIDTKEKHGIIFRKEDVTLQRTINVGLARLVESPEWDEMMAHYFSVK
jgi:polar amino acid transport system substrate-binding protein